MPNTLNSADNGVNNREVRNNKRGRGGSVKYSFIGEGERYRFHIEKLKKLVTTNINWLRIYGWAFRRLTQTALYDWKINRIESEIKQKSPLRIALFLEKEKKRKERTGFYRSRIEKFPRQELRDWRKKGKSRNKMKSMRDRSLAGKSYPPPPTNRSNLDFSWGWKGTNNEWNV